MQIKLLTPSDVEQIVRRPSAAHRQLDGTLRLCTIMEVLETAENARKSKGSMDRSTFLCGWHILRQKGGALADIIVEALDQDCLVENLFERNEAYIVTGLWSKAVGIDLPPNRTVRRLILRPSKRKQRDEESYSEMESWYSEVSSTDA